MKFTYRHQVKCVRYQHPLLLNIEVFFTTKKNFFWLLWKKLKKKSELQRTHNTTKLRISLKRYRWTDLNADFAEKVTREYICSFRSGLPLVYKEKMSIYGHFPLAPSTSKCVNRRLRTIFTAIAWTLCFRPKMNFH